MQLLASMLLIERTSKQPVYLQIAGQLTALIRKGILHPGYKLLSTRQLAGSIHVHRRTVVQAYDELLAQGWLESQKGSGTFVAKSFSSVKPQTSAANQNNPLNSRLRAGFNFDPARHLERPVLQSGTRLHLDDGFPDTRLAPLRELSRAYRTQLLTGNTYTRLGYGDTKGSAWLRQSLSVYLNETRGLNTSAENILIVRGTIMGLHLVSSGLLNAGDHVAVSDPSWAGASMNFVQAGAKVIKIPVDAFGMDVDAIANFCLKNTLRLVYVTSHHHYPTTVSLRADRRVKLLQLAQKYGFIVFEDDYDYDFHYQSKPLLPLAGADSAGMVLYCGSFTKTISPAFRVGYLVGPQNVIDHLAQLRRIVDRQGDVMLENAIAELIENGLIERHLRKSLRVYKKRRDVFCDMLNTYLGEDVEFQIPDGGMAVWAKFDSKINLPDFAVRALKNDLYLSDGTLNARDARDNFTRLGFASSTEDELEDCIRIMASLLR